MCVFRPQGMRPVSWRRNISTAAQLFFGYLVFSKPAREQVKPGSLCIWLIHKHESNPVNLCKAAAYCQAAFWEITHPISSVSDMFTCQIDSKPSVSCVGFNQLTMLRPHVPVLLWGSDATRAPRFEMEMRNNLFCSGNGNFPPEIKRWKKTCPAASLKRSGAWRNLS